MDKRSLEEMFINPPQELGMAPFWFLNEKLDTDELRWQVRQMHEKKMSGYVMHARYGLEVPYLSEEWFEKIGAIVDESEKLGMNAIIYDEYDWPSGMSGTKVLDDHPEYIMTYLDISWIRCENLNRLDTEIEAGKPVAVFSAKYTAPVEEQKDFYFKVGNLTNITDSVRGGRLVIDDASDTDIVFLFIEKEIDFYHPVTAFPQPAEEDCPFHQPQNWDWYFPYGKYVDLLNPEAVGYFIQTTHEEYKKRFGKYFGKTIKMLFTDEPGFYTVMREKYSAVQWSRILPREFEKKYGYSVIDNLPALVCDIGETTARMRHDFWALLTEMFEMNFVKQCADWCEENNLQLIGHFRLCNPFLVWQMQYQGNVIPEMKRMHIPGVDLLDNVDGDLNLRWGIDEDVWQIPNKIVTSVAHQYNKPIVMSESFALGGWKYTLRSMKILADWQHMMGINFIVPHAFHYSIAGQRKRECPPSQFYQNPMWDNYLHFSDYLRRIETMTVGSTHVADIALLFPMDSLWAEYPTGTTKRFPWNLSDDFSFITDKLLRWNLDYDILGQDELQLCTINNNSLEIQDESYRLLVVPPMTTIRKNTAEKITEFIDNGGKVLFLGLVPWKDTGGKKLSSFVKKIESSVGMSIEEFEKEYKADAGMESRFLYSNEGKGNIGVIGSGPLHKIRDCDNIPGYIQEIIEPDVTINVLDAHDGNIYCSHWRKNDYEIFFIVNSDERSFKTNLDLKAKGKPFLWNPETGEKKEIYCYSIEDKSKRLIIPKVINPLESFFIVVEEAIDITPLVNSTDLDIINVEKSSSGIKATAIANDYTKEGYIELKNNGKTDYQKIDVPAEKSITLSERWAITKNKPNVLILNEWRQTQGFSEGVGWFNMLGGTVTQDAEFYIKGKLGNLKAVFDRVPEPYVISVNGTVIEDFKQSTYLDHQMKEAYISRLVREGENNIHIEFSLSERAFQGKTGIDPIELMFDPVMITGDFVVETEDGNSVLVPEPREITTGTWTNQGFPFYSGSMDYRQQIYLSDDFISGSRCYLNMEGVREVAEVTVNGTVYPARMWEPFRIDITDSVRSGDNDIQIRVWNTLTNLLDLKDFPSGITGDVKIISKPEIQLSI